MWGSHNWQNCRNYNGCRFRLKLHIERQHQKYDKVHKWLRKMCISQVQLLHTQYHQCCCILTVDCAPGFYEQNGQCVLCPVGQYQDLYGSTGCTPCPDALTWDVMGATDVTQCLCESHLQTVCFFVCLSKACSPANRTRSPQGFHKFKSDNVT